MDLLVWNRTADTAKALDACRELYAEAAALAPAVEDMIGVLHAYEARTAASRGAAEHRPKTWLTAPVTSASPAV